MKKSRKGKAKKIDKGFAQRLVATYSGEKKIMGESAIYCPKCKVAMDKKTNGKFIIDACPRCKGIFLDKHEIDNIAHQGFFNYVLTYFKRPRRVER